MPQKKEKAPKISGGSKELEKQVRRLEREIDAQEKKLTELNAALETAATDYQELLRLTEEKEREEAALEALMTQWAEVSAALEQD